MSGYCQPGGIDLDRCARRPPRAPRSGSRERSPRPRRGSSTPWPAPGARRELRSIESPCSFIAVRSSRGRCRPSTRTMHGRVETHVAHVLGLLDDLAGRSAGPSGSGAGPVVSHREEGDLQIRHIVEEVGALARARRSSRASWPRRSPSPGRSVPSRRGSRATGPYCPMRPKTIRTHSRPCRGQAAVHLGDLGRDLARLALVEDVGPHVDDVARSARGSRCRARWFEADEHASRRRGPQAAMSTTSPARRRSAGPAAARVAAARGGAGRA